MWRGCMDKMGKSILRGPARSCRNLNGAERAFSSWPCKIGRAVSPAPGASCLVKWSNQFHLVWQMLQGHQQLGQQGSNLYFLLFSLSFYVLRMKWMDFFFPVTHSCAAITLPLLSGHWFPWCISWGWPGHLAGSEPFQCLWSGWPRLHGSTPAGIALRVFRKHGGESIQTHCQSKLFP